MEIENNENKVELADMWREELSLGIYILPIPEIENSLEFGHMIADQYPPEKHIEQIGQFLVSRSPESHSMADAQALDILVPDGTPVLASDDGVIVKIEKNHSKHGTSREYADFANYILIRHQNGEYSQYVHLANNSIPENLSVGSFVNKGETIALTGMTGWTDRPHLHFVVFRTEKEITVNGVQSINPLGYKSLKPKFYTKFYRID